ncbi:MAG: flagellar hook-length control protein FliK [Bradyrhizobium sp.]|nr:flagellar hook-length control protein FliK [Bradyrhizobium sp.]
MFSVTSETTAKPAVANAPARSARTDQSPAPDSFSALIDSNAANTAGDDRPAAPDRPSPQQRPDEASAASDSRQLRDSTTSSSTTANAPLQQPQPRPAQAVAAEGSTNVASRPAKPGAAKSGIAKTAVTDAASDIVVTPDIASADPTASPQPTASTASTPVPIAVAIAAPAALTDVIIAQATPDNTTQPLAIAVAAIAASTSTVEASKPVAALAQGSGDQAKPASAPAAPAITPAETTPIVATQSAATTDAVVPAAAVAVNAPASATDTVTTPVSQPVAKADAAVQADPELAAAAVAATIPVEAVGPKATLKTTAATRSSENAVPIRPGIAPGAADASAASASADAADKPVAPQPSAVDGREKTAGTAVDTPTTDPAKPEASTVIAATPSPRDHRASAAVQVQNDTADVGQQAASAIQQPQAQSAATLATATPLTVTAATAAAVPLNGLALQIAVSAQSGNSRFEIRLDPAELGRIDVRIDVDRHGQLTSHLTVEKPETLAMLRQDAPQLQRALDNAGFKTGDGGLQFSLRDHSSSGQNTGDQAGRNAQRLIISEDDSFPAAVAGRTYGRMSESGSGVDIRV